MKKQLIYILGFLLFMQLALLNTINGASFIWTGNYSSSWTSSTNWSSGGGGTPSSGDNITINSNAPNNLVLDQNRTVTNFTINGDTLDLGTYTLTTTGVTYFNGGLLNNGNLNISGSLCHFGGATINARTEANCGYYHMNGGSFLRPVILVSTGSANTSGTGNCIFSDSLSITHGGSYYFTTGSTYGDNFQNVTITNNSTREIYLGTADTTFISGNLILNNTSTGGFVTGNTGGVTYLASGKTISIGSSGFTNNYLTLKNFYQQGATSQTLTLTGTAILNLINANFDGNFTVTSPGILLKNSTFNGATSITRNGSSGNYHCDGGNNFIGAFSLDNAGSVGRVRFANTIPDNFYGDATFNSTGGQDVQIAYSGNNVVSGNLTLNSNKVVFNTGSGKVTFSGGNSQILNGSNTFQFKKVAINKNSGFVTVNTPGSVDDTLFLIKGTFLTKATNLINLKSGAKVTGASDSSFIDGPVKKTGNTAFVFPTGANNSYRPIEISAPSTTTSEFIAEFKDDSLSVNSNTKDTTLARLLRKQYWNLNRTSGTSQVYVTVGWNSHSSLVDTLITVASWNGSQWKDLGNGIITGNHISGSIKSLSTASYYNQFIIGYKSNQTLPVLIDCNNVTTATSLQSCLQHSSQITITGNIDLDGNGLDFPLEVDFDVTLQGTSEWWKTGCPLITSTYTFSYFDATCFCPNDPDAACLSLDCEPEALYLFSMQPGATIQNLRIRGASLDHKDFNDPEYLCGGIYVFDNGATAVNILNCEIFGFSQAGIWKNYDTDLLNISNCYIHKVKGRSSYGIGYGVWSMGKLSTTPTVNFTNCIFDDCKAAIDGQGYPIHWNILHCSLSQFFQGEDIHMHNYNEFHKQHLDGNGNIVYDCHIKYPCSGLLSNSFNGLASDLTTSIEPICNNVIQSTYSKKADPCIVYNDNLSYIPLYDIGGANITVENSIFHKKWNLGTNGNMSLKFPNRDVSKGGVSDNKIIIRKNTFSTFRFTPSQAWFSSINSINYNNTGYAKISDNYIDASVWSADPHNIVEDNYFDYKSGDNLAASAATAPQPNELSLQLNDGTNALPTSYSLSPLEGQKYIQYVNVNTQFYLEASITNAGGLAESYYIIRPNPNTNGVSTTSEAHVISNENYFFDSEEKLNGTTVTKSITYNKPGLYGIDVLGFDAHDYGTAGYDFRASSWQHIPVIVKDDSEEQVLYFNVKDSYKETGTSLTGVMKQAYLNNTAIWSEEITEGGDGWEAVRIDLKGNISGTTTAIKTLLLTDGTPNVLSFGIFMNSNIDASLLKGLFVWVDDVYIKKYDSPTGDNLIKDGSIERILQEGKLETGISENWLWFQDISKTFTGCGETTDGGISSQERKSGEYAIQLEISPLPSCTTYVVAGSGETVVSVGTTVDFTDLLSCNDYWTANTTPPAYGTSAVGFIPFPGIGGVTQGGQYFVPSNISLGSNQTLTLIDCILAFSSDVGIAVSAATAELEIKSTSSTTGSHLFGCANMWNGIVNDNGTLDLFGNINFLPVKIEDAKVAITSNGGNVQLRSVSFDHNGLDIDFDGTTSPFSNQSKINGCEFLCTDGVISKSPFEGVIPNEHVVLNGITNFNFPLGTSGPGAGTLNNFSDAINAVSITNSKVILQRNIFSRIYRRDDGILATDYGRAINIRNNGSATNYSIEIMDNEFNDVNLGIKLDNIIGSTLKIYNNTFNNPNYQFDPNPSTVLFYNHRTAIKVQNPIASPAINAEIYGNTITDFRIGIHTLNTPDINIGTDVAGALVAGNTIEFDKTTFPLTNYYGGIWLQNCAGAKVANNSVDNSTENEDLNFRGLDIETSADCFLNCNIIDNIGVAINIYDNCGTTKLRSNEMSHFFTGVWLNGPNGASIDVDQGDATSLESWGNEWNWQAAPSLKVDGANYGLSVGINWYYEGSDVNGNKFSPRPFNANIVSPEAASGTSGSLCTSFFRTTPNRKDNFGPVVGDSAVYTESVDKSRYLATQNSYIAMKNDSSLIYRGDSYDSDFESFFLRMDSSNVAKFQKVRKLAATWPDSAQAINNLITDTNDIEFNSKTFNSLYFSKIINGTPVNSSDSTFLDGLLTGTYITIGESFYYAAAVQSREMHPETSSLRIGTSKPVEVEAIVPHPISIIKIYPNPANNSIKAEIQNGDDKLTLIELYSSIGNLIASQTGNSNLIELNIQSYHEGLYKLRAYTQKGFTDTKTFSIVR